MFTIYSYAVARLDVGNDQILAVITAKSEGDIRKSYVIYKAKLVIAVTIAIARARTGKGRGGWRNTESRRLPFTTSFITATTVSITWQIAIIANNIMTIAEAKCVEIGFIVAEQKVVARTAGQMTASCYYLIFARRSKKQRIDI